MDVNEGVKQHGELSNVYQREIVKRRERQNKHTTHIIGINFYTNVMEQNRQDKDKELELE